MLPSEIPKLPTDLAVRGFPGVWELILRLPSRDGSLSLTVLSPSLSFFFGAYLLSKTMGCLSGWLTSSASVQKLFCRIYLDEFVGEKVVSPSYSSVNLGPL